MVDGLLSHPTFGILQNGKSPYGWIDVRSSTFVRTTFPDGTYRFHSFNHLTIDGMHIQVRIPAIFGACPTGAFVRNTGVYHVKTGMFLLDRFLVCHMSHILVPVFLSSGHYTAEIAK